MFATAALAAAAPPVNPLVEGREPDPVAREFHLPDKPAGGYASEPSDAERGGSGGWVMVAAGMWDVFLDRFTMPLGTAVMKDAPPATDA